MLKLGGNGQAVAGAFTRAERVVVTLRVLTQRPSRCRSLNSKGACCGDIDGLDATAKPLQEHFPKQKSLTAHRRAAEFAEQAGAVSLRVCAARQRSLECHPHKIKS